MSCIVSVYSLSLVSRPYKNYYDDIPASWTPGLVYQNSILKNFKNTENYI